MLATFVIGLREGLEAALIVGIIAAFLRRNGKSMTPMWIGVGLAVLLSLAVGVGLKIVEAALDQKAQEALETVIGVVAVVFVTGMIMWMSTHSRGLKKELEAAAGDAVGDGTARALAVMAFLAVLKEGFETAVFLLATFQAASNGTLAALGAVLGVLVAIGLGYGLYTGGVSLDLGKFFRYTGIFLVLVAAGLVVTALRTAHEAGWLNAGQQTALDLGWLAPGGSIRGALFTGVLGIPPQPRVVEVVGWFAYLVPMLLVLFWPRKYRPGARGSIRLKQVLAGCCVLAALVLALVMRPQTPAAATTAPLTKGGQVSLSGTTLTTPSGAVALTAAGPENHEGVDATKYTAPLPSPSGLPATITAADLAALAGGRLPIGVDAAKAPGPYAATWASSSELTAWVTADGDLLDAVRRQAVSLTVTDGGLATPRTVTVGDSATLPAGGHLETASWQVSPEHVRQVVSDRAQARSAATEAQFWGRVVPAGLLVAAAWLLVAAWRAHRRLPRVDATDAGVATTSPRSAQNAR